MDKKAAIRNVRLYRWYVAFKDPILWGPVLISCLIHLGKMSLSDIYFMESIVLIGAVILQVPTGALADLIGRQKTIVIGSIFYLASIILFAFVSSPFEVWGANILWMLGASMCSGADSAFLYDSLKEINREAEYKKIDGEASSNQLIIVGICSLFAGYLAQFSLRLPLILSIFGVLFSSVLPFFFKEPTPTKKISAKEQFSLMKISVLFVANHKEVKWIIGFMTLVGITSKIWFFTYNPYFEMVKLDLRYYGLIFFILNCIAWFFSRYAYQIAGRINESSIVKLMILLIGLPIIFMGSIVSVFSVGMVFPQNIVRGFMRPFFGEFLNKHLNSENRATVLSIQSAVSGFAQFIALGGFGILLVSFGLPFCLQILGAFFLIFGGLAVFKYQKTFS